MIKISNWTCQILGLGVVLAAGHSPDQGFSWDSLLILHVQSNTCRGDPHAEWSVYCIVTVMQSLLGFYVEMEIFS